MTARTARMDAFVEAVGKAKAMCYWCDHPDKWTPASWDDGDYYHGRVSGIGYPAWCDANEIWHELWDDPQ